MYEYTCCVILPENAVQTLGIERAYCQKGELIIEKSMGLLRLASFLLSVTQRVR
jgi:hypothetical protein